MSHGDDNLPVGFSNPVLNHFLKNIEQDDDLGHVRSLPLDGGRQSFKRQRDAGGDVVYGASVGSRGDVEDSSSGAVSEGVLRLKNGSDGSTNSSSLTALVKTVKQRDGGTIDKEQIDPRECPGPVSHELPPKRKQLKSSISVGEVRLLQSNLAGNEPPSTATSSSGRTRSLPSSASGSGRNRNPVDVSGCSGSIQADPKSKQQSSGSTSSNEARVNPVTRRQSSQKFRRRMSYGSLRVSNQLPGYDSSRPCAFDILSDEVVLHILSYLSRGSLVTMARTCKRLRAISYDETLWARVDLANKWLGPGVVGAVVSRGTQVLRMAKTRIESPIFQPSAILFNSFNKSDSSLNCSLGSSMTEGPLVLDKLQYLDLSNASVSAETVTELVGACRNLVKIGLENCEVSDKLMKAISRNICLKTLHLGMAKGVTPEGLKILGSLDCIEELNLGWINLSRDMLGPLRDGLLTSNAVNLSRLSLAGGKEALTDDTVEFIAMSCQNLVELDVSDSSALTHMAVQSLVEHANNLVVLSMSRCYKVELRSFLDLVQSASLKEFNAHGMLGEAGLLELRKRLSPIEINASLLCNIARPTTGIRRSSIWNMKTRQ